MADTLADGAAHTSGMKQGSSTGLRATCNALLPQSGWVQAHSSLRASVSARRKAGRKCSTQSRDTSLREGERQGENTPVASDQNAQTHPSCCPKARRT